MLKRIVISAIALAALLAGEKAFAQPSAVDLGLTSGTLWASCNVGAGTPEAPGDHFSWGETTAKNNYSWSNYTHLKSGTNWAEAKFKKYNQSDNKTTLDDADDAATATLGSDWSMPTKAQWQELMSECTWTWTIRNGHKGYLITGPNDNTIFLPAAGYCDGRTLRGNNGEGYYWSEELYTSSTSNSSLRGAWRVLFSKVKNNTAQVTVNVEARVFGLSVRAVAVPSGG